MANSENSSSKQFMAIEIDDKNLYLRFQRVGALSSFCLGILRFAHPQSVCKSENEDMESVCE